ncbi:MAG: hypothetical protein R2878_03030 [Thermoleophilia bacterium]
MGEVIRPARDAEDVAEIARRVDQVVSLAANFPSWVFRQQSGYVSIVEDRGVWSSAFGRVVEALAGVYGDVAVRVLFDSRQRGCGVIDPAMPVEVIDSPWAAFELSGTDIARGYAEGVEETSILEARLWVLGSSERWALWCTIELEIGVLLTPDPVGPWLHDPEVRLWDIDEGLTRWCIAGSRLN